MQKLRVEDTYFKPNSINVNGKLIDFSLPKVMGILNVTDDSFYEGSRLRTDIDVLTRAELMLSEGATFLDIGGYSTRPNAMNISIEKEISRLQYSINAIIKEFPEAILSVDTFRSEVAQVAIDYGALMINDISGFNFDPKIIEVAAKNKVPYILMHLKGSFETMHDSYQYESLIDDVKLYFKEKIEILLSNAITDIILDPGFGFSKSIDQNYELFHQIEGLQSFSKPILIGISRKSMIYRRLNTTPENSLNGTIALNAIALSKGASILRVHDVKEAKTLIDLVHY